MNDLTEISGEYIQSWHSRREYWHKVSKDRCIITNKNWTKLKKIHLNKFLSVNNINKFGFLFRLKVLNNDMFKIKIVRDKYYKMLKNKKKIKTDRERIHLDCIIGKNKVL